MALSALVLTTERSAFPLRRKDMASMIMDLPAPVSPVKTLKPSSKSIDISSINAKLLIYRLLSIEIPSYHIDDMHIVKS